MGLTVASVGRAATRDGFHIKEDSLIIALAGNPNVGKSTVFNALTGMRQHTGNWPGKTVTNAVGETEVEGKHVSIVDLPGCYSLAAHSAEEEVARDFILGGGADAIIVVCDSTCLERNLILALQILQVTTRVVICVNLLDEARKKHITIDLAKLENQLGVPVIGTEARGRKGIKNLLSAAVRVACQKEEPKENTEEGESLARAVLRAEEIAKKTCRFSKGDPTKRDRKIDKILTGKMWGFPLMFLMLMGIFWLTMVGANYPSQLLSSVLFRLEEPLMRLFAGVPWWLSGAIVQGGYRVTAWVVSVMLPPMAIFFPLFTLLEDLGYLPRVAFNLDRCFQKCRACGKQALTMCMGFGCNAAGVVGCRIIDSPRERLIAILTNTFVPCNGRFPTMVAVITMFFATGAASLVSAAGLAGFIILGVVVTLAVSFLLSVTVLRGMPSSFTLELPPYRKPQIGSVIVRSVLDRTIFVLGRAVVSAAPAGILIWIFANVTVGGETLLAICTNFLNPFAVWFGLDGVILMAFILGLPANEIVMPIIIMAYVSGGALTEMSNLAEMRALLIENGWTTVTAVCTMLFSLLHWPCATTLLTIRKETGSLRWTIAAFLIPAAVGFLACFLVANVLHLW